MQTVYVGMSGGVDSSVSALLLREQGFNVVGVYMKNWSEDLPGMKCPWAEDLADAKRVAVKLGIDFQVWDFEKEYREKVVEYMLREFRAGKTPNPDIMCNQEIKFKLFYERAMEAGADFIATGHYANVKFFSHPGPRPAIPSPRVAGADARAAALRTPLCKNKNFAPVLARAADENKDQTYFLYRISDEALARTIFPIGEMMKPEVKRLAEERGLHNAYKKESMGVCFVGEVGMKDFLKNYIETEPGEIRESETDKVLGYHEGAIFYTIGQRHGLYVASDLPYYVVKKDVAKNIVYVSKNLNNDALWTDELATEEIFLRRTESILSSSGLEFSSTSYAGVPGEPSLRDEPLGPVRNIRVENSNQGTIRKEQISVRLRHRAPLVPATFDGEKLHFAQKIKRPASGQSAVFYDGEICLGGGIIA